MKKFFAIVFSVLILVGVLGVTSCAQILHIHNFANYVYNQDATCISNGTKTAKCSFENCQETKTIIAENTKLEHIYTLKTNQEQHWQECDCGDKLDLENHSFKWIIDEQATQDKTGLKHKECSVCEYKTMLNTQVPILDHIHDYNQAVVSIKHLKVDATCTAEAEYFYSCVCGESGELTFRYGKSLGHSYTNYIYNQDATCNQDGTKTAKCDRCDSTDTLTVVGTKLTHTYKTKSNQTYHWQECTCGDKSVLESHAFEWIVDLEATETQTGLKHKECLGCGYKTELETIIPVLEHSHTFEFVNTVAPTCAGQGYDLYKCACDEEEKRNFVNALEHSYENADCPTCLEWINRDYSHLEIYNDDYGYTFLGTMSNGRNLQTFYERLDTKIKLFHENHDIDATTITVSGEDALQVASIKYSDLGLTSDMAISVWSTYLNDNPLYYWMSRTVAWSSTNLIVLTSQEYDTGEERKEENQKIYKAIQSQASIIDQSDSAYRKALAYHDAIVNKVNYAYDSNGEPETSLWAHNIAGVLNGNSTVCEGYSRTFQILLNYSGVENLCVTGTANDGAHAWNMIRLDDGKWYWCDLTWDDNDCENPYTDINSLPSNYNYFCIAGNALVGHKVYDSTTHGINFLYDLPTPATDAYNGDELLLNQSFVLDDVTYVKVASGLLEIKLIKKTGVVTLPESVTYNGITYKIISVANKTVNGNSISCTSVIEGRVTKLTLPSTVKIIYPYAFSGCRELTDVVIPKSVVGIGDSAFRSCTRLDKIDFGGTMAEWQAIKKGQNWKAFTGSFLISCQDGNINSSMI